ncbi:hypothetical protein LOTGIDRAFT_153427 [Lottia gigantea]|uniref:Alpha-1,3-glucosyltransferase n=1 Tax=Lottia gigantea TaxID=225164 RepID=V4AAY8_LOTGI|nr:hypothetical protein LOTGIDRAFT_153427 [Lottia gigantea]ESO93947.1 hypothetical protein LOTGIDRAFT_153427 [Lottia gigantea]
MAAFYVVAATISCFKLLFLPAYRSTDFEVHRNWLAITHSLPVNKWYTEATSEWTLDYPPFFAWFEYGLSQIAQYFDEEMLKVENLNYSSEATILFQRMSVIFTDFIFIYAVKNAILLIGNIGLLIVDHIHFQYNGFLMGIFLLSIVKMYENKYLQSALLFCVLLNLKHIYLYVSPVYFIYLLTSYCYNPGVISVFSLSFAPFIYMGQLSQVLSRLFPFKRGLCHAYWAPNFWALYNIADKALFIIGSKLKLLPPTLSDSGFMTGGLVQEFSHTVLPSIKPFYTVILTLIAMLPALFNLFLNRKKGSVGFVRCLILCAYASFLFGWHVHEKAILIIIIPMILLVFESKEDGRIYLILSTIGYYSLFPLLFTQFETPIKVLFLLLHCFYSFYTLSNIHKSSERLLPIVSWLESVYLLGIVPLEFYNSVIHSLLKLDEKFPFIPLLLTSIYCSLGVVYTWLRFYFSFLQSQSPKHKTS